jgi:hypothetical protein
MHRKEYSMPVGDKSNSDESRTIVPSHHPMPGVDDEVIDAGRKTGAQLPPARDAPEEKHVDWDDRESGASDAPEAADVIKPFQPGRK